MTAKGDAIGGVEALEGLIESLARPLGRTDA